MNKTKTETLFDEAADVFVKTFKGCVHLQEDTAKQCLELVKGWSQADDWAKHSQKFMEQTMPGMKKASEESMKLWKANADKCMKLLQEGFATTQAPSPTEAQKRLEKLWQDSLKAMQENTETVVKLSSEAMQAYADYMKGLAPEPAKP